MSDVQFFLLEFDSNKQEATNIAKNTAQKLGSRDITLIALIGSLNEYLNNDDGSIRAKTMAYLAEVLAAVPPKLLSRQQRDLLSDFLLSRIEDDGEGLGHCARSLISLEKLGRFDAEKVVKIMNVLLDSTNPLSRVKIQSERFAVLTLMDLLLSNYRSALHTMHTDSPNFLTKFIDFFDGEKDPRNLMLIFSILHVPMVEWDVSDHAQALFDAVFNYFPITFRPPPGDPYGITAQQLKDRLRDCISSTAYLAPYAFPALLDKLDSTSPNVKRDVLQAISSCAARYGPATMNLYSITLWDALKFEVLNMQEDDLAEEALVGLGKIASTLSTSPHEEPLQLFIKPIAKECNEHYEDAPTKQSNASTRILKAICQSCSSASDLLTKAVVPQLLALYQGSEAIPRRRDLLEVLNSFLETAFILSQPGQVAVAPLSMPKSSQGLLEFSDVLYDVYSKAVTQTPIKEVSFRCLALKGLRDVSKIRQLLQDSQVTTVIRMFIDIVIEEAPYGRDDVKAAAMDALVDVAQQRPQIVIETAVPIFMSRLPDSDSDIKTNMATLEAFAKLSKEKQVFGTVVLRLKNKLQSALRQKSSSRYQLAILLALLYAFSQGAIQEQDATQYAPYYSDLVVPLLSDFCGNTAEQTSASESQDEAVLEAVGRLCNVIMRPQSFAAQTELSRNVYSLFRTTSLQDLPPFSNNTPILQKNMIVSTHLIASLQREARPHPDIPELFHALLKFASNDGLPANVRDAALDQIALVVNKFMTTSDTKVTIAPLMDDSEQAPSTSLLAPARTTKASIAVAMAILKGLVLRLDPLLQSIVPVLLNILQSQDHGNAVAQRLGSLLSPSTLFTKENHCIIYALHRHRLFSLTITHLCTSFRTLPDPVAKQNYLIAVSGILQHTPYKLIKSELPALIPLLLQGLAIDSSPVSSHKDKVSVQTATIALFGTIIIEDAQMVQEHVSSLISRLLGVAIPVTPSPPSGGSSLVAAPKLRAAALACLASFTGSVKDAAILPYKQQVLRRLAGALDDRKRAVRAEAVRCRARWAELGDAEED